MLEVKQGQVWEIYSPLATNWGRAKVVEVVNGRARLRYQLVPDQVTPPFHPLVHAKPTNIGSAALRDSEGVRAMRGRLALDAARAMAEAKCVDAGSL